MKISTLITLAAFTVAATPAMATDQRASLRAAEKWCRVHPDARESGAADEHLISIRDCANRIVTAAQAHINDLQLRWKKLALQCYSGGGEACENEKDIEGELMGKECWLNTGADNTFVHGWWTCP